MPASSQQPRIAFDRQILPQAPLAAVEYRLAGQHPKTGQWVVLPWGLTGWKLAPFQSPDDTQLIPGCRYRVLWVDQNGQEIPPENTGTIPELHFFTGPTDGEPADHAMDSLLRTCMHLRVEVSRLNKENQVLSAQLEELDAEVDSLEEEVEDLKGEVRNLAEENEKLREKSLYTQIGEVVVPIAIGLGARQLLAEIQKRATASAEGAAVEVGAQQQPEGPSFMEANAPAGISHKDAQPLQMDAVASARPSTVETTRECEAETEAAREREEEVQRLFRSVRWAHRALRAPLSPDEKSILRHADAISLRARLRGLLVPDYDRPFESRSERRDRFLRTRHALFSSQTVSSLFFSRRMSQGQQASAQALAIQVWLELLQVLLQPAPSEKSSASLDDSALRDLRKKGEKLLRQGVSSSDPWGGILYDCSEIVLDLLSAALDKSGMAERKDKSTLPI